jgi:hypothetical protein
MRALNRHVERMLTVAGQALDTPSWRGGSLNKGNPRHLAAGATPDHSADDGSGVAIAALPAAEAEGAEYSVVIAGTFEGSFAFCSTSSKAAAKVLVTADTPTTFLSAKVSASELSTKTITDADLLFFVSLRTA